MTSNGASFVFFRLVKRLFSFRNEQNFMMPWFQVLGTGIDVGKTMSGCTSYVVSGVGMLAVLLRTSILCSVLHMRLSACDSSAFGLSYLSRLSFLAPSIASL